MFEKEAEEYAEKYADEYNMAIEDFSPKSPRQIVLDAFKVGAEFGYNKANEWHYVKDEKDLPKEEGVYLVYRKNGFQLLAFDGSYWVTGVHDDVHNTIIAWKEIIFPKENE